MEILDIVDENGEPTGERAERERAHTEGIRHRTSHVWLFRRQGGEVQILLQKRSRDKDSFPGCYDISSAGHIPAGSGFKESAVRELKEELGVDAAEEDLIFCGNRHISTDHVFHGKPFHDRQYSRVFLLEYEKDEQALTLQKEEIESALWMPLEACIRAVREETLPSCIFPEELEMVRAALAERYGETEEMQKQT